MSLLEPELSSEEAELLAGWRDVAGRLTVSIDDVEAARLEATGERLLAQVESLGWLDLATEGVSTRLLCDVIGCLHEAVIPVPIPLLELWLGSAVAARVAGQPGSRYSLSVSDLMAPPRAADRLTTGWLPRTGLSVIVTLIAVEGGAAILTVPAQEAAAEETIDIDVTLPAGLYSAPVASWKRAGSLTEEELARFRNQALCLQSAALAGQAHALLDRTVAYLKTREQFGVKIGSFQALKHRAADLHTELHAADRMVRYAAWSADHDGGADTIARMTKAFCVETTTRIAHEAVQLHGGVGFTWEGEIHFGLRRCVYLSATGMTAEECAATVGKRVLAGQSLRWAGD